MKALLLVALVAIAHADVFSEEYYQNEFTNFMLKFEKNYAPEEFFRRFSIFKFNVDFIFNHNSGNSTYECGVNQFSDLTSAEFKAIYLGFKPELADSSSKVISLRDLEAVPIEAGASIDWTTKGAVTPVKNQGNCGSCWAFSTTGGVEGVVQIKHGHLTSLSEQALVDCAGAYGNQGCNGGLMDSAFKYVKANGLPTEAAYPYKGVNGACKAFTASADTKITGYVDVAHTESALLNAVNIEPISVAIEADQSGFQNYKSGIFSGACGKNLDHGVLTVGYGTSGTTDYWKVKNSWGTSWGEAGYIRMIRGQDECGIANEPSYPTD